LNGLLGVFGSAFRTNEPQVTAVIVFTAMNGIALAKRTSETPFWFVVGVLAFWPVLAFLANLCDPIPEPHGDA